MRKNKEQKRQERNISALSVETGNTNNPFSILGSYTPLSQPQDRLYRALREGIPIIDAAVYKIINLVGGFRVTTENQKSQQSLNRFLESVKVNSMQCGIEAFISQYLDSLLTYGTSVGEIVLDFDGNIAALYNAPLDCLEIKCGSSPLDVRLFSRSGAAAVPIRHPERVVMSVLNPEAGKITGNSLLKGLPFVSNILLKIYNTVGINFERIGNVRFAVIYNPGENPIDKSNLGKRTKAIATEWSNAMRETGSVRDFVCAGDVDIKVIGADNQVIDTEVPVKQMLEQIIAKLGVPPFMLGLSWSSTERMSSQQADLLTSELEAYRRILTPVISKIALTYLRSNGFTDDIEVVWNDITLQDEVELAKARLYNAQADELIGAGGDKDE